MADRVSQSVSKGLADLVLNDDDFLDQPTFQKATRLSLSLSLSLSSLHTPRHTQLRLRITT